MAARSKDFVGIAEGIKTQELSEKSKIERLNASISSLSSRKFSLEDRKASLEASIASAYVDVDEDGECDEGRIAHLEAQLSIVEDQLSDVRWELARKRDEVKRAQDELERVMEEKARTLFEIQERARKTSHNISTAGGMFGAYSGVGASLQSALMSSHSSLSQAAGILGGSVEGASGGSKGSPQGHAGLGSVNVANHGGGANTKLGAFAGGGSGGGLRSSSSYITSSSSMAPSSVSAFGAASQNSAQKRNVSFKTKQETNINTTSAFGKNDGGDKNHTLKTSQYSSEQASSKKSSSFSFERKPIDVNAKNTSYQRKIPGTPGRVTGGSSRKLGNNAFKKFELIDEISDDMLVGKTKEEIRQIREANALNRANLLAFLKKKKAGTYQRHHIIPCNRDDKNNPRPHPVLVKMGMDLDDESNCIMLQSNRDIPSVGSKHYSKHGIYNEIVNEYLDKIDINQSVEEIEQQVYILQQKLKRGLETGLPLYPQVDEVKESYAKGKIPKTPVERRGEGGTEEEIKNIWRRFLDKDLRKKSDDSDYEATFGAMLSKSKKENVQYDISSIKSKIASFFGVRKSDNAKNSEVINAQRLIDSYCTSSLDKVLSKNKKAVRLADTVEFQDEGKFAQGLGDPAMAVNINGYNDGTKSYVKSNGPHPQKTAIHEHNHQLSCNDVKNKFGRVIEYRRGVSINRRDRQVNEALTEYFTKKMMGSEYPANPNVSYKNNMLRMEKMASAFGEDILKEAYYQNKPQLLKEKYESVMGKDIWERLSKAFDDTLRDHTPEEQIAIRDHYMHTGTRLMTQTDIIRKKAVDYANRCATIFVIKSKGVK